MDPSTAQHSFFAPPVWTPYPRKPKPRKRRHDSEDPEEDPPSSPPSPSDEDPDQRHRRGGHTKRYNKILTSHNLPLPPKTPHSLRTKHQSAMTAILHRSLLTSDYPRAARAFALLIRCIEVDIRKIWALGLEILLHRPEFTSEANTTTAVEFLHRLILLYPYNHTNHVHHPALTLNTKGRPVPKPSVVEFYPALFALLVKASVRGEAERVPEAEPGRIKEQIETLMMTPPWSNMGVLWLIRGMVCSWIADLSGDVEVRREAGMCFDKVRERGGEVPEGVEWSGESGESGESEEEGESGGEEEENGEESEGV